MRLSDPLRPQDFGPDLALWAARRHWEADELTQGLLFAEVAARAGAEAAPELAKRYRGAVAVFNGSAEPRLTQRQHFAPVPGRILHVVSKSLPFHQSGYTIRTRSLVRAQRRAGLDPQIAMRSAVPSGTHGEATSNPVDLDGTPVYPLSSAGSGQPLDASLQTQAEELADLVERLRPAVLHAASDFVNAMVVRAVATAYELPYVYEVRGFWEVTRQGRRAGTPPTDRYVWTRARETYEACAANAVVTLARTMAAELVARGVRKGDLVIVPNAVDPAELARRPRDAAHMERLGLAGAELVAGYVTSLVDYEGVGTLIAAVAELRRGGRDVRLLIVGDGPAREALETQAEELGGAAVFTGSVPHLEVPDLYACLDVFVIPRRDLPVCRLVSPLKPYEAMLLGLPVVVSDLPVLRELAEDSKASTCSRRRTPGRSPRCWPASPTTRPGGRPRGRGVVTGSRPNEPGTATRSATASSTRG